MIPVPQTQAILDTIYQRILAQLQQTITPQSFLYTTLTQLCTQARQQDQTVPLSCLPVWSYLAAGGNEPWPAIPLAAAWRCLHLAGKLLNNVAKQSPNPFLPSVSPAELLNIGIALTFLAQAILTDAAEREVPVALALQFHSDFAHTGLHATAGQQVQLQQNVDWSIAEYGAVVAQRSGKPFALALRVGARLWLAAKHNEKKHIVQSLADCGYHLGMMIQLADDFNGVWRSTDRSDLVAKKCTWPLLYAQELADPDETARLQMLIQNAPKDPKAEAEAREFMVQLGVPMALALESEKHCRLAEKSLATLADSKAYHLLIEVIQRVCLVPKTIQS